MQLIMKLTEVGMDFWIKCSFIFLLSSCSLNPFVKSEKMVKITDEIINSPYAMQIIQFDKQDEEIYLLNLVQNNIQTWFKDRDIFISTKYGKIVKTIGLENDFEIISYNGFLKLNDSAALIRFKNPESNYMPINFKYRLVEEGVMQKVIDGSEYNYKLIEENFEVPLIKWKGKNYYWIDENNYIWKSEQDMVPFKRPVKIKVLKKYSG